MGLEIDLELDTVIYENFYDLKELLEINSPRNSQVRNSSTILRRFLIHGDLNSSAISRGVKLSFFIPPVAPYLKCIDLGLFKYWQNGDVNLFGVQVMGFTVSQGPQELSNVYLNGLHTESKLEVKFSNFLKSPVASIGRDLISRKEIIKYVANKTGGDHYDKKREEFELISKVRGAVKLSLKKDLPNIEFNLNALSRSSTKFVFSKDEIDPLLVEILSTAKYIVESPSVNQLIQAIEKDLK